MVSFISKLANIDLIMKEKIIINYIKFYKTTYGRYDGKKMKLHL